jgi:hypothetical protein
MKFYITLIYMLILVSANGQIKKTEVLTLGVFHFNFPNLDQ